MKNVIGRLSSGIAWNFSARNSVNTCALRVCRRPAGDTALIGNGVRIAASTCCRLPSAISRAYSHPGSVPQAETGEHRASYVLGVVGTNHRLAVDDEGRAVLEEAPRAGGALEHEDDAGHALDIAPVVLGNTMALK